MSKNLISVIMPVKNGSNYLKEALDGIKAQNLDVEIIVINDGSSDDTVSIAENFGCTILHNEISKGLVVSKNIGLRVAKGKYVMFHDHDDVMNDGALSRMLEEIQGDEGASAVMAKLQDFSSPELSKEEMKGIVVRSEAYYGLFSGAILMERSLFEVVGPFDESLKAGDIIDWNNRMKKNNLRIKKLDFVAANRRIHSSNFGRTNKDVEYKDYASILRAKLRSGL